MDITVNTKMITLIGSPLSQSYAAKMHNAGYRALGLPYIYFYTETGNEQLGTIIDGIRQMPSFAGCGVTKPNKIEVMQYLDELDPLCEKIGACNLVVKEADGRLKGYNTDAIGFYVGFTEETGIDVKGKRFFCFGAGGAGRAICSILAEKGAEKIYITDMFEESTKALVADINNKIADVAIAVKADEFTILEDAEIVINASGVGMGKSIGLSPLPKEYMRKNQLYYDACYNPEKTQFLLDAEEAGAKIVNGLMMSLYQGVVQFEKWTKEKAPVEVMKQVILEQ